MKHHYTPINYDLKISQILSTTTLSWFVVARHPSKGLLILVELDHTSLSFPADLSLSNKRTDDVFRHKKLIYVKTIK